MFLAIELQTSDAVYISLHLEACSIRPRSPYVFARLVCKASMFSSDPPRRLITANGQPLSRTTRPRRVLQMINRSQAHDIAVMLHHRPSPAAQYVFQHAHPSAHATTP